MNGTSQSVFTQLGPLLPAWLQELSTAQRLLFGLVGFPVLAIALNVFWQLVRFKTSRLQGCKGVRWWQRDG